MGRIISLTTDFGLTDGYVGAMKGVILSINPQAQIVDITHQVSPQNIEEGAFLFAASARYFARDSIHVVVVDPGVGGARRPIALQVGETTFVGPDNGVLTRAVEGFAREAGAGGKIVGIHLTRPEYHLGSLSHTFQGRDLFAPVAAHLSLGVPVEAMGDTITDWTRLSLVRARRKEDGALVGVVMQIDHFGNAILNVVKEDLAEKNGVVITIGGVTIRGIFESYGQAEPDRPLALFGSSHFLEIAVRNGNAARELGLQVGDQVTISP